MLLNIKSAFLYILQEKPTISAHTIREIHALLSQSLLPRSTQGSVRNRAVHIAGSDYVPLHNPQELEIQLATLLTRYHAIQNPFNKAIYIHNNIAYLQYFTDCNKRVARILQNLNLLLSDLPFLSFNARRADTEIKARYKDCVLAYYENGDFLPYVEFFIHEYSNTVHAIKKSLLESLLQPHFPRRMRKKFLGDSERVRIVSISFL